MNDLERLADEIERDATVVALTGAGISAPSGVPTFRGDGGVWEHFDEGQFTYGRFRRDPAGFWEDRLELQVAMFGDGYEPNVAHEALAELGEEGYLDAILTQNTDGLHERALRAVGSPTDATDEAPADATDEESGDPEEGNGDCDETVGGNDDPGEHGGETTLIELHGNAQRAACTMCGRRIDAEVAFERVDDGELPPTCDCGGTYKPDVVLFGEQLPGPAIQRARSLARDSDVFLAIGSSLVVEPAASLPQTAASTGGTLGIVNLESTPCDDAATVVCRADVTTALPALRDAVLE
ncbi:Sir2 family NAD-dependent protein deacetylase [Halostagnicola sp. A-GB9-2]|uniref:SIR2 family NAD-dependent protein deacylase n=1 Tax=Halostagnicola sp. A-GB9-2 TaxID=3048066 RepID=UPI0024BF4F67|nr:Sir2 family NAD-dependent protein deacetylase [Halostagnicola sp. A-GB9-2]MDJ1432063.1 Sir2 family NAD-dependent protein deacetylase [Halostagnicola sp. A-GB9-2]